ncbi:hypothetical protein [Streptomyces sp. PTD5-9]|uniref:hypothetical protein n=1 Tax=Streptomyces sp. PTD5-9 TaxID=3120150 RepID=UPI00300AC614
MKFLHHIAATTAVLWMAAGAAPVVASTPTDTEPTATEAAAAGWPLAYEADPKTGRYLPLGFVRPDGRVMPLSAGQQGYIADPFTGKLVPVREGQRFSPALDKIGK